MGLQSFVQTDIMGTITLADGTGTPVTMTCDFDRGDFTVGPIKELLQETVKIIRRGRRKSVAPGGRIFPTGSFSAWVAQFTDASADVISDFILKQNKFSANVSTLGTLHPVYAIDITMTIEASDYESGATDLTFTMADCVCQIDSFTESPEGNQIAISFEVLGAITGDLSASEIS